MLGWLMVCVCVGVVDGVCVWGGGGGGGGEGEVVCVCVCIGGSLDVN